MRMEKIYPDDLEGIGAIIGGWVEMVPFDDFYVLCDEDGRLKNLPYNCTVDGVPFVGTIVVAGRTKGGKLGSVKKALGK
ncbi:MAG: DUF3846 domain-containing protein [Lachnospiraceae bacterium]|nr:DUF3846 domain-containing protein [Lachnospiraceae bacterium]